MKLANSEQLWEFTKKYPICKKWIEQWVADVRFASWKMPQDVKNRYSTVSFLANKLVIFNVKGNEYRMVVTIGYSVGVVSVKWVGKHQEYDKINWNEFVR